MSLQVLAVFCLLAGYTLAHPQAVGWAGIWQNGMWTSADDDMDNIPGIGYPEYFHMTKKIRFRSWRWSLKNKRLCVIKL